MMKYLISITSKWPYDRIAQASFLGMMYALWLGGLFNPLVWGAVATAAFALFVVMCFLEIKTSREAALAHGNRRLAERPWVVVMSALIALLAVLVLSTHYGHVR